MGATGIYFVEPGVKINGEYYRNKLLKNCLLPDMKEMSELFIFQQDGAPAHTARDTVVLLMQEHPNSSNRICGHPIVQTLTPWIMEFGASCKKRSTKAK